MFDPHANRSGGFRIRDLPRDASGHFVLCFYWAVASCLTYLERLTGGAGLDPITEAHPFLLRYKAETEAVIPALDPRMATDAQWDALQDRFVRACHTPPPLEVLGQSLGLSTAARRLLMLAGLVEEDSRFGDLFAWLQPGAGTRRLTLELAERMLTVPGESAPGGAMRALADAGLVLPVDSAVPRTEWALRVPTELWALVRGEADVPPPAGRLGGACAVPPLVYGAEVQNRIEWVADALASAPGERVALRADPGADTETVATELLSQAGCRPLFLEGPVTAEAAKLIGPWCTLAGVGPVITFDLGPGETAPPLTMPGYAGPLIAVLGREGGLPKTDGTPIALLDLPPLTREQRTTVWQHALGSRATSDTINEAAGDRYGDGHIRQIAQAAIRQADFEDRQEVTHKDLRRAARALNHRLLDGLAERLDPSQGWDDLILPPGALAQLRHLEAHARNRDTLGDRVGASFGSEGPVGVRALFSGVSGTGKTMAARILAGALGKDLYRLDLSAVINKYIGETEKNLNRVLSRAEALDVVLLLDEGDALLGARTEVKSSNDRYANLETNYLLQRLESYRGIVLVTTNYGENVDKAFQRRMDTVIAFPPPRAEDRRRILALHLPMDHTVPDALLSEVASRCQLTGGQLRNVALRAAVSASGAVGQTEMLNALAREHEKAGAADPFHRVGTTASVRATPNVQGFLGALRAGR